jgi:hypothetical protein
MRDLDKPESMSPSDALALAASTQSVLDVTVGKAMEAARSLPSVTKALGVAGGALSVLTVADGLSSGNTYNVVAGTADAAMFAFSFVPGAATVTGPYFAMRFGMEVVKFGYEYPQQPPQPGFQCVR